ncbi:hypothetical protein Acr_21g0011330 [Actinidia rufa]|uniref:Uncharacterized protein n=1 Tax=Actinidia rufa TaxID=165716 RepID=A0A7J0GIJ6_9ERIC|nr:hypothetical protein Acr_21g0011330 [Actinidia rufa]
MYALVREWCSSLLRKEDFSFAFLQGCFNNEAEYEALIAGLQIAYDAVLAQVDKEDWRQPFIEYFKHGRLPDDVFQRMKLKGRAPQFAFFNDTLYRRSYDQLWLRCLSPVEAQRVMHEVT